MGSEQTLTFQFLQASLVSSKAQEVQEPRFVDTDGMPLLDLPQAIEVDEPHGEVIQGIPMDQEVASGK